MTDYGSSQCHHFVQAAVRKGISIVSGLAYGIDAEAHRATLRSGGICIAVLGGGFDYLYPASHAGLAREIVQSGGVLISEYPPDTTPRKYYFLERNRIIAALSRVLLVVEAGEKSGTRNTAAAAAQSGATVCVIPGDITREQGRGIVTLIKDGAEPVAHPDDILAHFIDLPVRITHSLRAHIGETESQVYGAIPPEGATVDSLLVSTGLPAANVRACLTVLEIDGLVRYNQGLWHVISL
jgi:DNA processing protein